MLGLRDFVPGSCGDYGGIQQLTQWQPPSRERPDAYTSWLTPFFPSYSIGFPCASHIQSRSSLLSLWKYSCQHSQKCALPTAFSRVCLPSTKSTGKVNHHRLLGQGCMLFFCACFCVWECACVRVRVPLAGLNKSSHWRGSAFLLTAHRGRTSI